MSLNSNPADWEQTPQRSSSSVGTSSRSSLFAGAAIQPPLSVTEYERARKVIWPFRKLHRPMGALFDEGKITHRDLGWASGAPNIDSDIREAARVLLAHSWQVPFDAKASPKAQTGPQVIYGSKYLQKMERVNFAIVFALIGYVVGFSIFPVWNSISYIVTKGASLAELLIGGVLLAGGLWMVYRETTRYYNDFKHYSTGREGENAVVERMMAVLDGNWTIFRNWVLPGTRRDDIDVILVGPAGVWAVEVKTYNSAYKRARVAHEPKGFRTRGKTGTRKRQKAPDEQAESNAIRLREALNARGVPLKYVKAVVAFPEFGPANFITERADVWYAVNIDEKLAEISSKSGQAEEQLKRVTKVLTTVGRPGRRGLLGSVFTD